MSATDNSGRTVAYVTSGAIASGTAKMTVTDVTGGSTVYAYDTSGRINQVTRRRGVELAGSAPDRQRGRWRGRWRREQRKCRRHGIQTEVR
ncbi:hypothetical protein [Streptomyces sp. BK022]|uniref:hypothetical protein n=1 Tax=Streptomyces sp. BK022 TaxID=2512123 RepID=UPI001029444A|nr:hypothetical protein [Streptomyces sp. BK022]